MAKQADGTPPNSASVPDSGIGSTPAIEGTANVGASKTDDEAWPTVKFGIRIGCRPRMAQKMNPPI